MTAQTRTAKVEDRFIGRTEHGDRVYISMEIRHHGPEYTTTGEPIEKMTRDHRTITEYDELAISGAIVEKGHRNAYAWGQIANHINPSTFEYAIPLEVARPLFDLWTRCHLNGMHAGCIHQDDAAHVGRDDWKQAQAEQTAKCPEGYRYGSRWLIDVLSDNDISDARAIIDALQSQPEYSGN